MIALIARAHLTPAASNEVDRLLRENPINPALTRFCKDRPADPMADAATWADDARTIERTADWHFIDIPVAAGAGQKNANDVMKWCKPAAGGKPGCIITALYSEASILRDNSRPAAERARALRYVIHLVGDLSQPLHAADNSDRGGNCTEMNFLAAEKTENLHAVWDYRIIARDIEARKTTQAEYAKALDTEFWRKEQKIEIPEWMWESHLLAATAAYGNLRPSIPLASPDAGTADTAACTAERTSVAALHISIDDEYVSQALPVIRAQLAKAGYRLAAMLNQTFQ